MPVTSTGGSALQGRGTTERWRKLRRRVLERDGYSCAYCGARANSVDHVVPRSAWPDGEPGVDDLANLVACCTPCNSRKGARVGPMPRPASMTPKPSRSW
jgi:5-methylcytosine-specific restriction endonuclease McrA